MSELKQDLNKVQTSLLQCPFCGGEARLQHRQRKRGYYVICKECGCRTPLFQYQYDSLETLREEAVTAWNHRKPMDDIVERLKEIGTAYCCSIHCNDECEDCDHGSMMRAILGIVKGEV